MHHNILGSAETGKLMGSDEQSVAAKISIDLVNQQLERDRELREKKDEFYTSVGWLLRMCNRHAESRSCPNYVKEAVQKVMETLNDV